MNFNFKEINRNKLFRFTEEQKVQIFKVYDRLCEIYKISIIDVKDTPLSRFKPIVENQDFIPHISYLVQSESSSFYLYIITRIVRYNSKYGSTSKEYLKVWGLKELGEDFGDIVIRKETFSDKITEIFKNFDIDFKNDRDFSKTFYVLCKNETETKKFLNKSTRQLLKSFPDKDFQLEVKNNVLSFGLPKKLSLPRLLQISEFLNEI
ncbi:hypothetical protein N0B16_05110 [Chryseobacterium sp. GMJ5]|uniref:Uncharacterized protein n=1 Tax=Chryseobacterium gilvum TaxID=2976534 RepID=A0ABT2VUY3_9FLAO|nr:hypothetical protein [Chryseobacterium gilvum]MCU7613811.1 hypothetical protein [Chryseobacterium gilvum]